MILLSCGNTWNCLPLYQAPSSDETYASNDDDSADWSVHSDWLDVLDDHNMTKSTETVEATQGTELPIGLHWDYSSKIHSTNEMKMEPTLTQVKPDAHKLFKTPLDAVMAVFPLLFWETITDQINKYAQYKIKKDKLIKR